MARKASEPRATRTNDPEAAAARWLIEQDDPEFSQHQEDELVRWLTSHAEHCRVYVRYVRSWRWTALQYRDEDPIVYTKRRAPGDGASRNSTSPRSTRGALLDRRFGEVLARRREEFGLPKEEIASRAGMSVDSIDEIETGAHSLTFVEACVLARALGIAPSRLATQLERVLGEGL